MDFCGKFTFGCLSKKCYEKSSSHASVHSSCHSIVYAKAPIIAHHDQHQHQQTSPITIHQHLMEAHKKANGVRRSISSDFDKDKLMDGSDPYSISEDNSDNDHENQKVMFGQDTASADDVYYIDTDEDEIEDGVEIRLPIVLSPKIRRLIATLDTEALRLNQLIISSDGTPFIVTKDKNYAAINSSFIPRSYEKKTLNSLPRTLRRISEEENLKRHFSDIKVPNLIPPNPMLRILLVFPKTDPVYDALVSACQRLNVEPSLAKTNEAALELFQNVPNGGHHIIVVDSRNTRFTDAESLGRSIRNSKGNQHAIMVAVVKKSVFEKDDTAVVSLLDAGYNRCIIESPHVSICCSELRQIQHSLVRPQNVISTQQALYTALHRAKDGIIITDDTLRTQFANKSTERLLNLKIDEIIGRPLTDLISIDGTNIISHTSRHREFDGNISIRRKSQDIVSVHYKVIPVTCVGRTPTHLVITMDCGNLNGSDVLPTIPQAKEAPRGSLHSIRRGSFDVRSIASDGLRRTSLAKLSSLPLEAPITKVLTILTQVQEGCSYEEAKLIDRVMEFLKREGLYSPQMKEIKTDDPVANDLIGALLTQGPTSMLSSRRSSNDSIIRGGRQSSITTIAKIRTPSEVTDLLETALNWDFEIFRLEELTEKRPLLYLGLELFRRFDVYETLQCDEQTFKGWLIVIETHYRSNNTYHNSTHAADVMQATAAYLQQLEKRDIRMMDSMDEATALIAAATHDIDHPGRSSAFLCNSDDQLALLYNDICVLESHHAATTFKLTLSDEKINIFKNLEKDLYKSVRTVIVDMILATEMTRHFEHLAKFVSVFGADSEPKDSLVEQESDENQMLVRRMLIKCADVSNPTRPLKFCVEWARRIAEEYFSQTDDEKRLNLPIVMPMFDRTKCSISKSQIGFIEYIIQDMMNAWDGFIDMPEIIQYMEHNYNQWKVFEEQGIKTLNDIKRKQISITSQTQFTPLILQ